MPENNYRITLNPDSKKECKNSWADKYLFDYRRGKTKKNVYKIYRHKYMNVLFFRDKIFGFRCINKIKTIFEIEFDGLDNTISEKIQRLLPMFDDSTYKFFVYEYNSTTYYARGDCVNYIWRIIDRDSLYELLK